MALELTAALPPFHGGRLVQPGVPTPGFRTSVLIDGISYAIQNPIEWGFVSGVQPQRAALRMVPEQADKIIATSGGNQGIKLSFIGTSVTGEEVEEQVFEQLSLMPITPGELLSRSIEIVDHRWRWSRVKVTKTYNLIRKSNDLLAFPVGTSATRPGLSRAKNYYVKWTIKEADEDGEERPWSALDIVIDILKSFLGYTDDDIDFTGAAENINASKSAFIPMNEIHVGTPADTLVSQFLALSDNSLYIDKDGKIIIYGSRIAYGSKEFRDWGADQATFNRLAGEMFIVDMRSLRPTSIWVGNEVEQEVLLQYKEAERGRTDPRDRAQTSDNAAATGLIKLENVTRTVIPNQFEDLPIGTYITIEDALKAFGVKFGSEEITLEQFRDRYGAPIPTLASQLLKPKAGQQISNAVNPLALAVLARIKHDYRSTFRIPSEIMERIKEIQPVLADVLSAEHRLRSPSEVFTKLTWHMEAVARGITEGGRPTGAFLDSFEGGDKFQPAPASIAIIDKDLGIVKLNLEDDQNQPGVFTRMLPGEYPVSVGWEPDDEAWVKGVVILDGAEIPLGLKPEWEMSAVVSVVWMTPNDGFRLHWEETKAPDPKSGGPPVNVVHRLDTYRIRLDGNAEPFENRERYVSQSSKSTTPKVNDRLVKLIAQQEARRRYATFADQVIGRVVMAWNEKTVELRPEGPIGSVKYSRSPDGGLVVTAVASPVIDGPDIRNLLPAEVLKAVFGQVDFKESAQGGRT